jgi:hypothetical protein
MADNGDVYISALTLLRQITSRHRVVALVTVQQPFGLILSQNLVFEPTTTTRRRRRRRRRRLLNRIAISCIGKSPEPASTEHP